MFSLRLSITYLSEFQEAEIVLENGNVLEHANPIGSANECCRIVLYPLFYLIEAKLQTISQNKVKMGTINKVVKPCV